MAGLNQPWPPSNALPTSDTQAPGNTNEVLAELFLCGKGRKDPMPLVLRASEIQARSKQGWCIPENGGSSAKSTLVGAAIATLLVFGSRAGPRVQFHSIGKRGLRDAPDSRSIVTSCRLDVPRPYRPYPSAKRLAELFRNATCPKGATTTASRGPFAMDRLGCPHDRLAFDVDLQLNRLVACFENVDRLGAPPPPWAQATG